MKNFRSIYRALAQSKQVQSHHVVQYAILRAMASSKPTETAFKLIGQAFTPVRNKTRLEAGHEPHFALCEAIDAAFTCGGRGILIKPFQSILHLSPSDIFDTDAEFEQYKAILNALYAKWNIDKKTRNSRQYVYIFVRQDISPEYQLVQAAHAAAKMGHRQGAMDKPAFDDLYFSVIGVPSELALMKVEEELKARGDTAYVFREPDIGDQITAVSSSPIVMANRRGLLAYKKLVFAPKGACT